MSNIKQVAFKLQHRKLKKTRIFPKHSQLTVFTSPLRPIDDLLLLAICRFCADASNKPKHCPCFTFTSFVTPPIALLNLPHDHNNNNIFARANNKTV